MRIQVSLFSPVEREGCISEVGGRTRVAWRHARMHHHRLRTGYPCVLMMDSWFTR